MGKFSSSAGKLTLVGAVEPFDSFYAREFPRMVDVAYGMPGSRMAAEDLAQEAMLVAYRRWSEVGALERPGGEELEGYFWRHIYPGEEDPPAPWEFLITPDGRLQQATQFYSP